MRVNEHDQPGSVFDSGKALAGVASVLTEGIVLPDKSSIVGSEQK